MPTVSGEAGKPVAGTNEVYKLTYTVEDKNGNRTELVRKVTVTNQVPKISGLNSMAITEGEYIDLKSGITVHDFEDGDITNNLVCLTDLNTLTVGENIVQYSVSDADGNIVTSERKVIVLEKEVQKPEDGTETPSEPEIPSEPETPSEPEIPSDSEKPSEPGNGTIQLPQISGVEFGQGNATINSPLSVKVDTVDGLKELLKSTEESNFNIMSVEKIKEEDNFKVYLLKITKKAVARAEESYYMEIKVAKDNQQVVEHLENIVSNNNTNNGNGVVEDGTNNNTTDKNENSSSNNSNNSSNNSNKDENSSSNNSSNSSDNSNGVNKQDVPNTYDGGIASYILSGIGSLGLLSILNRRKRRK